MEENGRLYIIVVIFSKNIKIASGAIYPITIGLTSRNLSPSFKSLIISSLPEPPTSSIWISSMSVPLANAASSHSFGDGSIKKYVISMILGTIPIPDKTSDGVTPKELVRSV